MNYARLAREDGTASTAGTAYLAGNMLNTKTSRNAMGQRKKFTDKELEERKRERRHRYYMLHREELMKKNREYRRAHPEKVKIYGKRQQEKRREKTSLYNHEYYRKHRKRMLEYASNWRKANPDKIKGYNDKQKKQRRLQAERKKLERINPEVQASIFRDPQAAEHFKWLAERVRKKKEQSLNRSR